MRRSQPRPRESRAANEHLARPRRPRSWYKRCPFCGRTRRKQLFDKRRGVQNWDRIRIVPRAPGGVILEGQCCRICLKRLEQDATGSFTLELTYDRVTVQWSPERRAYQPRAPAAAVAAP